MAAKIVVSQTVVKVSRKRPGRHSKTLPKRAKKQMFFTQGPCRT